MLAGPGARDRGRTLDLLILRDSFFGVRRFGDFAAHLNIPRAVLSDRLSSLTEAGVLARADGGHGHPEYVLTSKGLPLWPAIRTLLAWGDEHYSDQGPRRLFRHAADDGLVSTAGVCCGLRSGGFRGRPDGRARAGAGLPSAERSGQPGSGHAAPDAGASARLKARTR